MMNFVDLGGSDRDRGILGRCSGVCVEGLREKSECQ